MSYTQRSTPSKPVQPSSSIEILEARVKSCEDALASSQAELGQIEPVLEREIDRITVLNTAYNQSGREDVWWPAYTVISGNIRRLEGGRKVVEKDRVKYATALRAARRSLAAAKEWEKFQEEVERKGRNVGENDLENIGPNEDVEGKVNQDI